MSTEPGARSDLRTTLLDHAVALTRDHGPDAVSLREVQRRSGVSPAAAYRHYRDRDALMVAVGQRASAVMADMITTAIEAVASTDDAGKDAVGRLRAGCAAYLSFAQQQPGLFRALFLTNEEPQELENPQAPSLGSAGRGPYQLLQDCLADLVTARLLPRSQAAGSDHAVWAACHGLAVLLLDSPLRRLDDAQRQATSDRLLDILLDGLTAAPPEDR